MVENGNIGFARFAVITAARNEEEFIDGAFQCVLSQKIKPEIWIIIDDGSSDRTYDLLKLYSEKYEWIFIYRKENRGYSDNCTGIVESIMCGYKRYSKYLSDVDYILRGAQNSLHIYCAAY